MNRLAGEASPYLRQHAENPVHWWPWGSEALEEARRSDRPILLSVGYSACHWCHVMEHESFSDPETAALMNEGFVNVKVDREERPDVDSVYMRAVQAMTGRGGWPMTVFLTPDGRPFFGGTYFPPEPRHGLASFRQVLSGVREAWTGRRPAIERAASELGEVLRVANGGEVTRDDPGGSRGSAGGDPVDARAATGASRDDQALLGGADRDLLARCDTVRGGLGAAPKFPQPVVWEYLLVRGVHDSDPRVLEAVSTTLREMARGGMRDHLGGAFHRYSVDAIWLVPHFEKMLYDNGLLLRLYLEGWRTLGDPELARVAGEIADDLLATFRLPDGAFAAAWDADSEGVEGKFYVWTPDEVVEVLGPETGARFCRHYDVTEKGNFEGDSIPHPVEPLESAAAREGIEVEALRAEFDEARRRLHAHRAATRIPPLRDDKVVTSWNAMAIRGLAEAGRLLDEPRWLDAAVGAADYLLDRHRGGDEGGGGLLRTTMAGEGHIPAFLEDWAALGNALLTLHEATLDPRWLGEAAACADEIVARFLDGETGLLHDAEDRGGLPVRPRDTTDSATPSGNALAAELLLRLAGVTDRSDHRRVADSILDREAGAAARFPAGYGRLLLQLHRRSAAPVEILVSGDPAGSDTVALLAEAWHSAPPLRVLAGRGSAPGPFDDAPLLRGREAGSSARAFVCRAFTCAAPVTTPESLRGELRDT